VTWGEIAGVGDAQHPVLSYDAASRGLTAEAAARRHADVLQQLMEPDRLLFKKIDSTLRGQPPSRKPAGPSQGTVRFGLWHLRASLSGDEPHHDRWPCCGRRPSA
jgi:hypothetical protein